MTTKYMEFSRALAAEFHPTEVKVLAKGGKQMRYVTARIVMNRLDEVLGWENWWDEYTVGEHSVQCRITVRLPDGTTVSKADAGAYAGMSDEGDDDKSGYSDGFKRAAVKFGVGRYLYNDGVPIYPDAGQGAGMVPYEPPPEPPKPHPQGKTNQHPNKSGFHNGQYASPQDTKKYLDRLKEKVDAVNGQWGDFWVDPHSGELPNAPECSRDVMTIYQADGHLVKWLVETGQIDQDALEKNGKAANLGRHAAIIMTRDKGAASAMKEELDTYMIRTFEAKKQAIYRKYPELAPEGFAEEMAETADRGDAHEEALHNGLSEEG